MNYEDEEYVRLYVRDTVTTKKIGWEGRTVLWHLLRVVQKSGILELQEGDDLVEIVSALCDLPESITKLGLERLASRGVTRRHAASLEIVRFVEAQNAKRSDRLRAQAYRDRQTQERLKSSEETASASRIVTARHDSSLLASPLLPSPLPDRSLTAAVDPKDLTGSARVEAPSPETAATAAAKSETRIRIPKDPSNMAEALELGVRDRSELLLRNPHSSMWLTPEHWPEVKAVAACLAKATGHPAHERLSGYTRDVGVQAVVALFAAGYALPEVERAIGVVTQSDWWRRDNRSRGLSSLTPEVVRRAHTEAPRMADLDPRVAQLLRERDARKSGTALPPQPEDAPPSREDAVKPRSVQKSTQSSPERVGSVLGQAGGVGHG